jgi:2-C-methyl-D-erythritol 4-phosphate cytidylyltransferase/2-C-methyl-D-erythritol 2,4-cyclodiphosphate synthase
VVLVHDAARPFATPALAQAVALAAAAGGAALAALPASDTVKLADDGAPCGPVAGAAPAGAAGADAAGVPAAARVARTLDRRRVWLAQTPQGFRVDLLRRAFEAAGADAAAATDECALVERLGAPVALVPGEPGNFKLTTPDDLARARARLEAPVAMGIGYDVHPFAPGRRLVLGGVEFVGEGDGLLGHSDADICCHAICDAVLGAAGGWATAT